MKGAWRKARICRTYTFDAAHWLPGVHENHKCRKMHGHTYAVDIVVMSEISPITGMAQDFATLDDLFKPILDRLDHCVLNDIVANPTAENLAIYIMEEYPQACVERVRVYEGRRSWAEVWADWAKVVKD